MHSITADVLQSFDLTNARNKYTRGWSLFSINSKERIYIHNTERQMTIFCAVSVYWHSFLCFEVSSINQLCVRPICMTRFLFDYKFPCLLVEQETSRGNNLIINSVVDISYIQVSVLFKGNQTIDLYWQWIYKPQAVGQFLYAHWIEKKSLSLNRGKFKATQCIFSIYWKLK